MALPIAERGDGPRDGPGEAPLDHVRSLRSRRVRRDERLAPRGAPGDDRPRHHRRAHLDRRSSRPRRRARSPTATCSTSAANACATSTPRTSRTAGTPASSMRRPRRRCSAAISSPASATTAPFTESDIVAPALTMEDHGHATALTPATAPTLRRLAELPIDAPRAHARARVSRATARQRYAISPTPTRNVWRWPSDAVVQNEAHRHGHLTDQSRPVIPSVVEGQRLSLTLAPVREREGARSNLAAAALLAPSRSTSQIRRVSLSIDYAGSDTGTRASIPITRDGFVMHNVSNSSLVIPNAAM